MSEPLEHLRAAVAAAGGQKALANLVTALGHPIRQAHVWNWMNLQGGLTPPYMAPLVEAATGVSCELLRPDLRWDRDAEGRVVAYGVTLQSVEPGKSRVGQ